MLVKLYVPNERYCLNCKRLIKQKDAKWIIPKKNGIYNNKRTYPYCTTCVAILKMKGYQNE